MIPVSLAMVDEYEKHQSERSGVGLAGFIQKLYQLSILERALQAAIEKP